ncbi:MAG TPA: MucB/RseB C-terminal domain-containing protein [Gallionella sp.]|nr:MucB/RseB C-terminal domain-containing protein [Gallionella sp.]
MRLLVVFCGLLLAAAANVHAEERPVGLDWLEVVAFAGHQTDYSGVFVYQYDNRVETSSIIHLTGPNGEYEKLESLDGPRREIIRHDGEVWSYANHKMVQVESQQGRSSFPSLLPEQLSALSANYLAVLQGMERVAGYNAQVILFQPKDNLRYTHKIWVHTDSGLLLKAAVLGDKNKVAEQYAFTQLQIGGKIDRSWAKECDAAGLHAKHGLQQTARDISPINSGWVADTLPSGFKKTMEIQRKMRGKHAPVTQMVYSDGLSAISIFIEPNDQDEDDVDGLSSRGAVNLYHKIMDQNLITVVGEVPPRTVMQVLSSVRYNGK